MIVYKLLLNVTLAAAPVFCTAAAPIATIQAGKLDAYFDALSKHQLANGSIAISQDGVLKYQRSVGFAKLDDGKPQPTDDATRYRIGSVSKLYTAAMVMGLVEGASITLDSKLAEFYPDLPNAIGITYRDLLQHRSGLADYTNVADFQTWRTTPRTHAQILTIIAAGGAKFAPRERVEYNNSNYLLLGYVLEKIYERPYDEILQRQIAAKLGLSRTYYAGTGIAGLESVSYVFTPGGWVAQVPTDPSIHGGAGGIVATPADLVRFIDAMFARRVVTAQSLETMRNQDGGSGMGLWPYFVAGQTGFGHGGNIEAFRSGVYHFPDSRISISYATNASVLSMDEIVDESMSLIFERGRKPPTFEPVSLSTTQQAKYLGEWRSAAGTPAGTQFRQFKQPDQPIVLSVKAGAGALVVTLQNRDFKLTALGNGEFALREIGYFLRFVGEDELVVRGPEWSYYLKRAG